MITSRRSTSWNLRFRFVLVALLAFGLLLGASALLSQSAGPIGLPGLERISVTASGNNMFASGYQPSISADGRFVAFRSVGVNMVTGEFDISAANIYVRDRLTNTLELISIGTDGEPANNSEYPEISADGRYITFVSGATNLVPNDTNDLWDVFVYDRETDTMEKISDATGGYDQYGIGPSISPDGRYVVYISEQFHGITTEFPQAYRYDRQTGDMEIASLNSAGEAANGRVREAITAGNDWVFFVSTADNLTSAEVWQGDFHVYGRNMATGQVRLISVNSGGALISGRAYNIQASDDGRHVIFTTTAGLSGSDQNLILDIYTYDLQTRVTRRATIAGDHSWYVGRSNFPSVSGDGRYVVFWSTVHDIVDFTTSPFGNVFLVDLSTGSISMIAYRATGVAASMVRSRISDDGRFIVFETNVSGLVPGDDRYSYDVYLVNIETALQGIPNPFPEPIGEPTPSPLSAPILLEPHASDDPACPWFYWETEADLYYEFWLGLDNPPTNLAYGAERNYYVPDCSLLNATYYYRVRSINRDGMVSPWSETRLITIDSPPQAVPDQLLLDTATPTLSWNEITWATAYQVELDDSYYFNSLDFVARNLSPETLSATVTPPLPNGEYFWRVRARHSDGTWGEWSESASFIIYIE
jgi:Tol biopolymer transport system component